MQLRTLVVAVFFLACAGSAGAQNLTLEFRDGRVSIDAANVPVRTILSEWARLGGTRVVGAERINSSALTIHLENVPEAQALEIVLRNVAGYMAAPRSVASSGASAYDRILVLATSTAPAASTNTSNSRAGSPGANASRNNRGPGLPQPVVDQVVTAGVKAILNFSPGALKVPPEVKLKSVDLTVSLESLSFYLAQGEETHG